MKKVKVKYHKQDAKNEKEMSDIDINGYEFIVNDYLLVVFKLDEWWEVIEPSTKKRIATEDTRGKAIEKAKINIKSEALYKLT